MSVVNLLFFRKKDALLTIASYVQHEEKVNEEVILTWLSFASI